jgi:hypothetical protein
MTDDADATPATPDPDDHVARLQAQIDAAKAHRAGYRPESAETLARGGPVRPTYEELGIIKTDDTVGRIAADASQEVRSRLSRLMSRFGRRGKKSGGQTLEHRGRPVDLPPGNRVNQNNPLVDPLPKTALPSQTCVHDPALRPRP